MLISYESIRQVHRAEKAEQLSQLPEGFFDSVRAWLQAKARAQDSNSLMEAESAKRLIEDIINRRQRKIVHAALACVRGSAPPKNMTAEEERFFEELVRLLKENKSAMLSLIEKDLNKKVKLLVKLPKLAGPDGKEYGPFEPGQIASLPPELARALVKGQAAEVLE